MDNKDLRGPQDRSRIDVNADYELRYWSNKFNVSEDRLREAVEKAGTSAEAVEKYLRGE